ALTTIDDAVRTVAAVAGDALRLARDEVTAARGRIERAQHHHCDESPGRLAPFHVVQVAGERGLIGAAAGGSKTRPISNTAPMVIPMRRRWGWRTIGSRREISFTRIANE